MILGSILAVVSVLIWPRASGSPMLPSLCCTTPDGINYKINKTFVTVDCASKCVCTQDAHLGCVPFCPKAVTTCPPNHQRQVVMEVAGAVNSRTIFLNPGIKDKACYCKRVKCKPYVEASHDNYCKEGNKKYKPGEEFVRGCNKLCRCLDYGKTSCVPLCPDEQPCPIGNLEKDISVPVQFSQFKCKCKAKACKPAPVSDKCNYNGKDYAIGPFIPGNCLASCECLPGGQHSCTSLCPPEFVPNCDLNSEEAIRVDEKVANSKCSCPVWKCVQRKGPSVLVGKVITNPSPPASGQCSYNGNVYKLGDRFTSSDCNNRCMCMPGNVVDCNEVLCQPDHTTCAYDEIKETTVQNIPNSSCTCTKSWCRKFP